jgi:nucleotidyltransferase AbiEii toxin of type IV toxin-antitoxin system
MTRLEQALGRVAQDLERRGARWALVGGLAFSVRAEPRTTRDIDLLIAAATDAEAESLVRDLCDLGYRLLEQLENEVTGRLATVRLSAPGAGVAGGVVLDLFFDYSGLEPEMVGRAELVALVPELRAPVVQLGDLLALKVLAARPRDLEDAGALVDKAEAEDLLLARQGLQALGRLGTHRRADLVGELDRLIAERATRRFRG